MPAYTAAFGTTKITQKHTPSINDLLVRLMKFSIHSLKFYLNNRQNAVE